jgi:hypothetical protein
MELILYKRTNVIKSGSLSKIESIRKGESNAVYRQSKERLAGSIVCVGDSVCRVMVNDWVFQGG